MASAPGTTPARQVLPPSVVTVKVPCAPAAQATRALTGLIATSWLGVPLCWGVMVGPPLAFLVATSESGDGSEGSEQATVTAPVRPATARNSENERSM